MICFREGFDPELKFSTAHVNIVVAHGRPIGWKRYGNRFN